ncbi:MAG: hypothetical protein MJ202_00100 [Lentisphaeria bacterium]|nr:hypothetical protein [Lentisphaeria bacterium]
MLNTVSPSSKRVSTSGSATSHPLKILLASPQEKRKFHPCPETAQNVLSPKQTAHAKYNFFEKYIPARNEKKTPGNQGIPRSLVVCNIEKPFRQQSFLKNFFRSATTHSHHARKQTGKKSQKRAEYDKVLDVTDY